MFSERGQESCCTGFNCYCFQQAIILVWGVDLHTKMLRFNVNINLLLLLRNNWWCHFICEIIVGLNVSNRDNQNPFLMFVWTKWRRTIICSILHLEMKREVVWNGYKLFAVFYI